jgi:curved DNA-binding protein CbpA
MLALLQLRRMELNCYELIGIERNASSAELTRAMRKKAAMYHPDKPLGPGLELPFGFETNNDVFIQLQKCQETLSSANKLSHYNRFGKLDFAYKNEDTLIPVMAVFAVIGYLVNFVVCTVFTAAPEAQASRFWIYSFLLFAMASELFLKFLGQTKLFSFIPRFSDWMVFEQVEAIKTLIPSMLSSGMLLSQLTHVDDSEMYHEILQAVSDSNRDIATHIVNKRNNITGEIQIVPAVIRLMKGPAKIPQATPVTTQPQQTGGGISFQRIVNWLFYAYLAKVVVSAIRSSLQY